MMSISFQKRSQLLPLNSSEIFYGTPRIDKMTVPAMFTAAGMPETCHAAGRSPAGILEVAAARAIESPKWLPSRALPSP